MRSLVFLAAILLASTASAQESCSQANPCEWTLDVDGEGLVSGDQRPPTFEGTVGDWVILDLQNLDENPHTLVFAAYGLAWSLEPYSGDRSAKFNLTEAGDFVIQDEATGSVAHVKVYLSDPEDGVQDTDATTTTGKGSPGLGLVAMAGAIVVAVALRRKPE